MRVGFEAATSKRRCHWCTRRKGQKAADGVIAPLNRVEVEEYGPDGSAVRHGTHTLHTHSHVSDHASKQHPERAPEQG